MPSDFEDLFADIGASNLAAVHGEAVTQYPLGVAANAVPLSGVIVDLSSQGETPIDNEDGSQVIRWGLLTIAASVTVTEAERKQQRDQFLVRGQIWDCEKILSRDTALQFVRVKREEKISTKKSRVPRV
jgi:hypothetical protein